MECFNPLCPVKRTKLQFKTERGLNRHLLRHQSCLNYHMINQNPKKTINNLIDYLNLEYDPNIYTENQQNKRQCTNHNINNFNFMNSNNNMANYNASNMHTLDFDTDIESDKDDNTYNNTLPSDSSSLSSNDDYLNNDLYIEHDQVLGNIFTLEQRCMIKLIKLVEDINCPDGAVTKIID